MYRHPAEAHGASVLVFSSRPIGFRDLSDNRFPLPCPSWSSPALMFLDGRCSISPYIPCLELSLTVVILARGFNDQNSEYAWVLISGREG